MIEVAEAEAVILDRMPRWPTVTVAIDDSLDRVLAENVAAERDQPPFDRITMDGIAIAYRDWTAGQRRFEIIGTQAAGVPALALSKPGQCVEVMTGAMRPHGADTVIPVERLTRDSNLAVVEDDAQVAQHQFIHAQGSDRQRDALLLSPGIRLRAPEIAVLAGAGYAHVKVTALPRVVAISTGDELVAVDAAIQPHQIRSTNDIAIQTSLRRHELAEASRMRLNDDAGQLLNALSELHEQHDALVLSGGVSMGQFDFVPSVLEQLGAELVFHRVNQRPGRPMWFGLSRDAKPIFALPGNPVSTLVCVTRYILPAFRHAAGIESEEIERVVLTDAVDTPKNVTLFLPVKLSSSEGGLQLAAPRPTNTSGDFISLAGTDGFVELPPSASPYPEGTVARLFRW